MAFKDDIEAMCTKAKRDKCEIQVRLPDPPLGWNEDKLLERLYQLAHLIKTNGCQLTRINETDFKIHV